MNWFKKQLGRQLSKPSGLLGLIVGKFMNKHNQKMYADSFQLLAFSTNDTVLEIGIGNGAFIKEVTGKIKTGSYTGIDISDTMLNTSKRKNKALINQKKVRLLKANIEKMPFENHSFDKIFTLNTIYFWKNPKLVMQEVKRVLKPNGKFVVGLSTKASMRKGNYFRERFVLYEQKDVVRLFSESGFSILDTTYRDEVPEDVLCIKGVRQ